MSVAPHLELRCPACGGRAVGRLRRAGPPVVACVEDGCGWTGEAAEKGTGRADTPLQ